MKFPWSNNTQGILQHAEQNGSECETIPINDKAFLAKVAGDVAGIWLPEEEGYTNEQRQIYRAGWYHAMRTKKGL